MKIKIILFISVLLLGFLLRLLILDKVAVSLSMDEVAQGYNAYSILKTGRDEYGNFLPLSFRSVGDYKSPLNIYLIVPSIALFGLNEFSVRFPVAVAGSLSVLLVFLIIYLLSSNYYISLLTALSVSISPWHIKASRLSHDTGLGLFFVLLGLLFFLLGIKKRAYYLPISLIAFVLSMYAYHAEKIFVPFFITGLFFIYKKDLLEKKKQFFLSCSIALVLTLPLLSLTLSPHGRTRADMTFITKDFELNPYLHSESEKLSSVEFLLDNNFLLTFNFWIKRYLDYFDINFLFIDGMGFAIPNSPDLGLLYLFELPFVILGLYFIFFKREFVNKKGYLLILLWFFNGPLPASLANNSQHTIRSLTMIPVYQFFFAIGFFKLFTLLKHPTFKKSFISVFFVVLVFSVYYFIDLFFYHYQINFSEYFMDGWKQASLFAWQNQTNYEKIIIDPRHGTLGPYTYGTPYLFILFYGKVDPSDYHLDKSRLKEGKYGISYKNITYKHIDWSAADNSDKGRKNILFIGSPWVLPVEENQIIKKFYILNGKEILRAVVVR